VPNRFDVVVLGSGVAGTAAAIAAAKRGAHTCMIAGAPGASALFSGAWRGDCPDGLRTALAEAGYLLERCTEPLPHPFGHLAPCDFAPPAQRAAVLADSSVVIGIAGLAGFDAAILAQLWSARAGVRLNALTLELPNTPQAGWAPVSLAGMIERQPDVIIGPVNRALSSSGARHAVLPAVIGTKHDNSTRAVITSALDAEVGEVLAVQPSLPGWRLHHALRMALIAAGVAIFDSKGLASGPTGRRVDRIELMNGDVVAGHTFVLATGKYAAGGIEADAEFREPALSCPVWTEHLGENFERVDSLLLTNAEQSDEQPLLSVGVHADHEQRPVGPAGDVVYDNVFVAGTVRAGWSVATHGLGDAANDGWNAGVTASA